MAIAQHNEPTWNVKTAASNFSKLFNAALKAPQLVTRRQEDRVVVLSEQKLEEITEAPRDLYGVVRSMSYVTGLDEALGPRKPYPRRKL